MPSPNSSTGLEQRRNFVPSKRMPPTSRNEMAELLANIIHSLVSSKLEKIDRLSGSSLPRDELLTPLNETVLRVGPLELDLIDRAAKRGDRHIDLLPREFSLLKYMMQRFGLRPARNQSALSWRRARPVVGGQNCQPRR